MYDPTYLDFVSNVLSSSRYYTNLQNQHLWQYYEDCEQNQVPGEVGTVLFCKPGDSDSQKECTAIVDDNFEEVDTLQMKLEDEYYDDDENINFESDNYCSKSNLPQSQENSLTADAQKTRPDSRKKAKTKNKMKTGSGKAINMNEYNDFDLKGLLRVVNEIEVQKKLNVEIFKPSAEALEDLQKMYGSEGNDILQLEQEQELIYQKACEKITPILPKSTFPKS